MNKGKAVRCVPAELFRGLQDLSRGLWEEKNPAAVRLGALLEEFGEEVSSMEKLVGEHEAACSARLSEAGREHAAKEAQLLARIDELRERTAAPEAGPADAPRSLPPVPEPASRAAQGREESREIFVFALLVSVLTSALGVIGGYPYLVFAGAAAFALFAAVFLLVLAGAYFDRRR